MTLLYSILYATVLGLRGRPRLGSLYLLLEPEKLISDSMSSFKFQAWSSMTTSPLRPANPNARWYIEGRPWSIRDWRLETLVAGGVPGAIQFSIKHRDLGLDTRLERRRVRVGFCPFLTPSTESRPLSTLFDGDCNS